MIQAYPVENGEIGIRRWRLALPSVVCSTQASRRAIETVTDGKTVEHPLGCAQVGSDKEQTRTTLIGIGAHPNVMRTVVVGLGCEGGPAAEVAAGIRAAGRPTELVLIQETGGMQATIAKVRALLEAPTESSTASPIAVGFERLTIGLSDWAMTGIAGARLVESLYEVGARLIWATDAGSGPGEALGYAHGLAAKSRQGWMPALGGEAATLTGLVAAGCHMVLAPGDLNHLGGHPIAPVVRFGVDHKLEAILSDDVDGWIDQKSTAQWMDYLEQVANGANAAAENFGGDMFAIARLGPTL